MNKKMVKKGLFCLLLTPFLLATYSCEDMMDVDSTRVSFEEDHALNHPNDSIYSVMGVLAEIQQLSDRCVLFGELRGDLMTVDEQNATTDLQQINTFSVASGNAYDVRRDFYRVINECNYILQRMDTTLTVGVERVMVPEYAQVRTLRAWTYWQMALIYGVVNYFTQPLLSVDDIAKLQTESQEFDISALADVLIADLQPVSEARRLDYGSVDGWYSSEFFLPTKALLGDLYLFTNRYEGAAQAYYDVIKQSHYTVTQGYANYWDGPTRELLNANHLQAYRYDIITRQVFSSDDRARHSQLATLSYSEQPQLLPAAPFVSEMADRNHFHTEGQSITRYFLGDLRGEAVYANGQTRADAFGHVAVGDQKSRLLITKFFNNLTGSETDPLENRRLTSLAVVRPSQLYLRLAEAVNRTGRPTVAFAVLKYGLSRATLSDTLCVDSNEVRNLPAYLDFSDDQFSQNIGTAARGCGLGIKFDRAQYVIPEGVDSVDYVEQAILDELAAETCFEGNRFFDLFCVSRRHPNHPSFMADRVSRKYADSEAMRQQLLSLSSWFVK